MNKSPIAGDDGKSVPVEGNEKDDAANDAAITSAVTSAEVKFGIAMENSSDRL